MMTSFKRSVCLLGLLVLTLSIFFVFCCSAYAVPIPTLQVVNGCGTNGNGSVTATVTAGFSTCGGKTGWVEDLWDSVKECSASGNGSATCTATLDCANLNGTNTFTASATDCTGTAYATPYTLTINNTPSVTVTSPSGTLQGPFDITGVATFASTLQPIKGYVTAYVNGNSRQHSGSTTSDTRREHGSERRARTSTPLLAYLAIPSFRPRLGMSNTIRKGKGG